ncbi:hypothetical protein [Actinomadura sp. DC4]|uniref:WD40 domain-containing protein n=1 Tax=Actinomadura sp. DC4 TaxID=3055069 RepID=UPI00339D5D71
MPFGRARKLASVAWSPAGDLIATGHTDQVIRVWDAATGEAVLTLTGHLAVRSIGYRAMPVAWAVRIWEIVADG